MFGWTTSKSLCVAFLGIGTITAAGCASNTAPHEEAAATGVVNIPLETTANGHTYRLTRAYLSIRGPTYRSLWTNGPPGETTLSTTLQTGDYSLEMYSWALQRDDGEGNFGPVQANLLNPYNSFTIANGVTTTVVFQFRSNGVIISIGSGHLDMKVAVQEVAPACQPFGDDCGSGSWCPPAGLTGTDLSCHPAGSVALGQPCTGPGDCVVNSTCLDFGGGAVCTELCPSSSFGAACASGAACVRCRIDYGICLPASGDGGAPISPPEAVCPATRDGGWVPDGGMTVDSGTWW